MYSSVEMYFCVGKLMNRKEMGLRQEGSAEYLSNNIKRAILKHVHENEMFYLYHPETRSQVDNFWKF